MRRSILGDLAIFALAILAGPSGIAQAQTAPAAATNDLQRSVEVLDTTSPPRAAPRAAR